ncbi:MAG: arginine N-succinyltransferase [Deltaproteobacteria bacterium]|nr:arginine N-succinyltransferase [Deltaproteobacteria bacterium]
MLIVRPVVEHDLDAMVELAQMASFGLTSLPRDSELILERIETSCKNFHLRARKPQGELYIFVMEETDSAQIVGTSQITSKVGGFDPFYAFRIETCLAESQHLNIRKEISFLRLVREHSGPTEIGGLFVSPTYRKQGAGRLMSLFRFLYMAERRSQFEPLVIAELRGVVDENGCSPFWEAVGRHFFDMNYPRADYLSLSDKRFIAELIPRSPIYIRLLPKDAQEVIGQVHQNTRPALKMLQDEGFRFNQMVDIFDAGPMVACPLDNVRIVRQSVKSVVEEIAPFPLQSRDSVIINLRKEFRACVGAVSLKPNGGVLIEPEVAKSLDVEPGDSIRFGPIRPTESQM